jgi:hypothetical protein
MKCFNTCNQNFVGEVKVKFTLEQARKVQRGTRCIALSFYGVGGHCHAPAALPLGKRPSTHCIGGWVGPRASLDRCRKSRPPPGFNRWTFQPVTNCCTNYTISAPIYKRIYQSSAALAFLCDELQRREVVTLIPMIGVRITSKLPV